MGKKINPVFFRLGKSVCYHSLWYENKKKYSKKLKINFLLLEILKRNFFFINISCIDIIISNNLKLNIYLNDLDKIEDFYFYLDSFILEFSKILKKNIIINFCLEELINAKILSLNILNQLDNKSSTKRIIKKEILKFSKQFNGCKVQISGRLEGVDIARKEWYLFGSIPLHTIRYSLDYYFCEFISQYGVLGIKTWIFNK
ncbi:30S ribosomal protein S3 [Candidatus Carsonella ruddii]|uniref:Small ribosomal subunit protein uS3 n=1 Tax=Carsonella ruddii TaxID=114186 RepID=A0A1U9RSE0_CARRU|nr:30S ribosomal protein S3 [Candidatus Carsonella ruddii]AQU89583.1 SSU ribosomal protein S3p (S3e) [Candidatus Carsonella ruddii]